MPAQGACEKFVVSTLISRREHGAVLLRRPAANGGTHGLAVFGRKLAQI